MVELVPAGERAVERAAAVLVTGAVIAIPTDTLYGLAVDPCRPGATDAIFEVKQRPVDVALPVLVGDPGDAAALGHVDAPVVRALMDAFWPGPLTIVVRARAKDFALGIGATGATVGLRCPAHEFVRALCRRVGPLAVSSANLHGQPTPPTAREIAAVFGSAVPLVVDGGECSGAASTVVDCSEVGPDAEVLREGVIPRADVERVTRAARAAAAFRRQ
ncbi:MAG TPA: L-threonylcarbamoyladenylate synthase [Acidimicrobiales bacterium]